MQSLIVKYFDFLDRRGKPFNFVVGLCCSLLIGGLDYFLKQISDTDFSFSLFYLLPIAFVAWFSGKNAGIVISLLCATSRIFNYTATNAGLLLLAWKTGTVFTFFLIIALLIAKVRSLLEQEKLLSRTDHLTNAANYRAFMEIMSNEIYRQRRYCHPFGLAYIDIDNFKEINDHFGHSAGDVLLQTVVATIFRNLRQTDVIARLGGDEFAILLPDTDETAGVAAINKIREQLHEQLWQDSMPITFSIGLISCLEPPDSADEAITLADNLMYTVKKSGKNNIRHAVYENVVSELDGRKD